MGTSTRRASRVMDRRQVVSETSQQAQAKHPEDENGGISSAQAHVEIMPVRRIRKNDPWRWRKPWCKAFALLNSVMDRRMMNVDSGGWEFFSSGGKTWQFHRRSSQ